MGALISPFNSKKRPLPCGAYSYQKPKMCKHQKALNYITEYIALIIIIVTSQISRNHYTTESQFLKIVPTFMLICSQQPLKHP